MTPSFLLAAVNPARFPRRLVSRRKRRFQKDGFDLDLSYIGSRIIAMGCPSFGREALYRNPAREVRRFFETYHAGHYKVVNLCSEPDRLYATETFPGAVVENIPFDDHQVARIDQISTFCRSAYRWLSEHPSNVVAVHCKAGKGRTGLVISAFLVFMSMESERTGIDLVWNLLDIGQSVATHEQAMKFYAFERTHNKKGVTIPSQKRYVEYFERLLRRGPNQSNYSATKKVLTEIQVFCLPSSVATFKFTICQGTGLEASVVYESELIRTNYNANHRNHKGNYYRREFGHTISDLMPVVLAGDVQFKFTSGDKKKEFYTFWLNTFFIEGEITALTRSQIDKAHKSRSASGDEMVIALWFSDEVLQFT